MRTRLWSSTERRARPRGRSARITGTISSVLVLTTLATPDTAEPQISRSPTGVNVNAMGATTVFLTFGNLNGRVAAEAMWCGALVPATPHVGQACDPARLFGRLPVRYDQARASGRNALTDIMTIPPSVARRAYQSAEAGESSDFYYVRRFVDPRGGPDEFVFVTCRMTDGGARTPFALTDVRVSFVTEDVVLMIEPGERVPPVRARIAYNGTGMLRGRWEVVRPGEEPPRLEDLLPEAALPIERRASQRRYFEVGRFDVFLPPGGEFLLDGPAEVVPTDAPGSYRLLLRIEASDDKEGDSSLEATGAGLGLAHSGAVAGFPMPALFYRVGSAAASGTGATGFVATAPADGAGLGPAQPLQFEWSASPTALFYRLEVESVEGESVFRAVVRAPELTYVAPPWTRERVVGPVRWRVAALGAGGRTLIVTTWRTLRSEPDGSDIAPSATDFGTTGE
jgi:hypothetical protein